MYLCGSSIMRWQSNGSFDAARQVFTNPGPNVMFGTKWPSMMSRCSTSASSSTLASSSASFEKSAESSDGAILIIAGSWSGAAR